MEIRSALKQLRRQQAQKKSELEKIGFAIGALTELLSPGKQTKPAKPARKRRKLSAAGRRAIIAAAKARWARERAAKAKAARA
jgi:hypothetical protein